MRPLPLSELDSLSSITMPPMLVDSLLPRGSITVVAGPTYSGKTFFALELARSVSLGVPFMGQFPVPRAGNVLLIEQDSPIYDTGLSLRLMFSAPLSIPPPERPPIGLYLSWHPGLNLSLPLDAARVAAAANSLFTSHGYSPVPHTDEDGNDWMDTEEAGIKGADLIILDTLRSLHSADENSSTEMEAVLKNIKIIRDATSAAILVVHHAGRSKLGPGYAPTVRGSTAIENAVDSIFQVHRKQGTISVRTQKARAIQPPEFSYTITSPRDGAGNPTKLVAFKAFLRSPAEEDTTSPDHSAKDLFMSLLRSKSTHTRKDLNTWASLNGVSERSLTNWLLHLLETGRLLRAREGREVTYTTTKAPNE